MARLLSAASEVSVQTPLAASVASLSEKDIQKKQSAKPTNPLLLLEASAFWAFGLGLGAGVSEMKGN